MNKRQQQYAYWKEVMDRYKSSGLSQEKFCKENSINFRKFTYYRHRLKLAERSQKTETSSPTFLPVKLDKIPAASSKKIRILHPSGIECSIPLDLEEPVLLSFLRGLKSC